ncbi:uncharacterized protein palmdb isoform X2 [Vanacampus margaritifer]
MRLLLETEQSLVHEPATLSQKATSETEKSDGQKLNKGYSSSENHDFVAMETTELPELETDSSGEVTAADEQIGINPDTSDEFKIESSTSDLSTNLVTSTTGELPGYPETGFCDGIPIHDEKDAIAFEEGRDELKRNESIASSVSDTLSSAESVYENEAQCKTQGMQGTPEQEQDFEENCVLQKDFDPLRPLETEETSEVEQDEYLQQSPDLQQFLDEEDEANYCNDDYHNLEADEEEGDPEVVPGNLYEPPAPEEVMLEQNIREDAMSDISGESCRYLDPDEVDECLRVEIAAASSDSETDEKWRTIFSSSINKEDDDSYLDGLHLSAQELFVQKVDVIESDDQDNDHYDEVQLDVPEVEELLEQPDVACSTPPQDVKCISLSLQGLSKISEDENENGKDDRNNPSTQEQSSQNLSDPNRKLPKDFCVIQETTSENVSTEHVDFQLTRKQWRAMEEQTKNQVVVPAARQPNFHCSHSCMYTPVRNIERSNRKSQDLESLTLVGDYTHTQFSPCSEDSGLDDSSYRSPNDDFETPVEREIRISMEREEKFRKERGLSCMGKSADAQFSSPSQGIPRSISTPLTPSFIITSSPTKEPFKNETNVIILDPSSDFTSNPARGEWCSEDCGSNLIILETSNLIIRSASEFSLNKACEPQEKMFLSNPFFKLRSRSTMSLVDEEIQMVKQREEELRKERADLYGKGRFNEKRMLSNNLGTLSLDNPACLPMKCKSSPSSPMKTPKMDRSTLSCDHRFPEGYTAARRKSAMALRWEAGEFTKND